LLVFVHLFPHDDGAVWAARLQQGLSVEIQVQGRQTPANIWHCEVFSELRQRFALTWDRRASEIRPGEGKSMAMRR